MLTYYVKIWIIAVQKFLSLLVTLGIFMRRPRQMRYGRSRDKLEQAGRLTKLLFFMYVLQKKVKVVNLKKHIDNFIYLYR